MQLSLLVTTPLDFVLISCCDLYPHCWEWAHISSMLSCYFYNLIASHDGFLGAKHYSEDSEMIQGFVPRTLADIRELKLVHFCFPEVWCTKSAKTWLYGSLS